MHIHLLMVGHLYSKTFPQKCLLAADHDVGYTIRDANQPVRSVLLADRILTRFVLACVYLKRL